LFVVPASRAVAIATHGLFGIVPRADAYIMKHIIHDWPDDACIKILKACRQGVNPGGKLLVVDCVIGPGELLLFREVSGSANADLSWRTRRDGTQFRELLAAAGWKLSRVIPTADQDSIVEGLPA